MFSTASAINATLFGSANVCYMIARDGELPAGLSRTEWKQATGGLFLTAALVILVTLLFDLSGIAMMGSAAFLLVYAAVNAGHLRVLKETGANAVIVWLSILTCLAMFAILGVYTWQQQPAAIVALVAIAAASFVAEWLYRRWTGRTIRTQTLPEPLISAASGRGGQRTDLARIRVWRPCGCAMLERLQVGHVIKCKVAASALVFLHSLGIAVCAPLKDEACSRHRQAISASFSEAVPTAWPKLQMQPADRCLRTMIVYSTASLRCRRPGPEQISFLDNRRYASLLDVTRAGAVIVHPDMQSRVPDSAVAIVTAEPYTGWALVAKLFHPAPLASPGIHPSAIVDETAMIDPSADIGPLCVIEAGAEIGPGCRIGPSAVIGSGVVLGRDCRIGSHASVSHALLGDRVYVYPGARIGQEGFGFAVTGARVSDRAAAWTRAACTTMSKSAPTARSIAARRATP